MLRRRHGSEKRMNMLNILERGWSFVTTEFFTRLSLKRDLESINSVERVCEFARTRAAFVTQKKLFGYVKERMGMTYAVAFQDDAMAKSLTIATFEIYAACLSDLTVFCVAHATAEQGFTNADREQIARRAFREGLEANTSPGRGAEKRDTWMTAFDERLARTLWTPPGEGDARFTESGPALTRWAPIAERLKRHDEEIVLNSIKFAWVEVRKDYLARLDPAAVREDWERG